MHDLTPLAAMMHLKELDRQAAPKLISLRLGRRSVPRFAGLAKLIARLRRAHLLGIPSLAATSPR